ncbi:hypothetical protein CVD28_01325 [Bacillus sp. M6-12]|uniref:hypothetical protein n=1 Tax=Bacillus sp. M6-12 TaxID=2054166 RepID=UPI000C757D30|nr:hypothetical protein [Bacillus sp. M6-12]PLS19075.1 hypothetical protein CVD28_01325 [Bacillus sp. M6-12]
MRRIIRNIRRGIFLLFFLQFSAKNVLADNSETIKRTTLDVAIPLYYEFSYNPNKPISDIKPIVIENRTNNHIYVKVANISIANDSQWKPTLIDSTSYTSEQWNNLTSVESEKNLALGIKAINSKNWLHGIENQVVWSTTEKELRRLGIVKLKKSVEVQPVFQSGSFPVKQVLSAYYSFEFGIYKPNL